MTSAPLHNRLFRQLIAIEDSGSIRKAAERLNLSQPALSKGIQEFERRLGMELLHRGRSGAVLTAPAREIVKRGRQILLLTEERSEEHTSELQSLMRISYAVFSLKKKKNTT